MTVRCRPGIVLTRICGQWILIPTREASEKCPHIIKLILPSAIIWGMIEKRKSEDEMVRALSILTHKDEEAARELVETIMDSLFEKGLLIEST